MAYNHVPSDAVALEGMGLIERAHALSEHFVKPLGRRWLHVCGVAEKATTLIPAVPAADADVLVAAAWLHDIGYAPEIGHTKFHPLDGATYLRATGWPEHVVLLVAHHSGARFEAVERGMAAELLPFPFEDSALLDALAAADLTTGPAGENVTYDERIWEILSRYQEDDPVHRTWTKAAPVIKQAVERTERRMAKHQPR